MLTKFRLTVTMAILFGTFATSLEAGRSTRRSIQTRRQKTACHPKPCDHIPCIPLIPCPPSNPNPPGGITPDPGGGTTPGGITPDPGGGTTPGGITPDPGTNKPDGSKKLPIRRIDCVLIFDTNGDGIREAAEADRGRWIEVLTKWEERVTQQLADQGFAVDEDLVNYRILEGAAVTSSNIYSELDKSGGDDVALFVWYMGHGAVRGESREHTLLMAAGDLKRADLVEKMKSRKAPLSVLLTESCSTIQGRVVASVKMLAVNGGLDVLSDLFLRHKGFVDINSSTEGQEAVALPSAGGLLSMAYAELSAAATKGGTPDSDGDGFVTWNEMSEALVKRVQEKYEPLKTSEQLTQTPQIRQLETVRIEGIPPVYPQGLRTIRIDSLKKID